MSILVPFNGSTFVIPTPNEIGWGTNLDNYFVAIANGTLQNIGGNFTLSAETDFGGAFGLKSLYYKTRSANTAVSGQFRLANAIDSINFRNSTNTGDHILAVNSSDLITFDGIPLAVGGSGTVLPGTTNTLAYYPASTNTVDDLPAITAHKALISDANGLPIASVTTDTELGYISGVTSSVQTQLNSKKSIATGNNFKWETTDGSGNLQETTITPSKAIASDSNGLPVASTTTDTELGYVTGVTSAIQTQLNSKANDSLVVHLAGSETITGAKIFSSVIEADSGINFGDTGTYIQKSGINQISVYVNGLESLQLDANGNIFNNFPGADLAVKNVFNTISTTSIGALGSSANTSITVQDNKTFTVTFESSVEVFLITLTNNDGCLVVTNFNTGTITLLGTTGSIVASSSPGAAQLGIFKSAGQNIISFKSGVSLSISASSLQIQSLSGAITNSTNWS